MDSGTTGSTEAKTVQILEGCAVDLLLGDLTKLCFPQPTLSLVLLSTDLLDSFYEEFFISVVMSDFIHNLNTATQKRQVQTG